MRVSMIGAGYVGLTTGVCLAEMGHDVICADIDKNRIANLNEGSTPFMENGLAEMMQRNVAAGRLAFTDDLNEAVAGREIIMIAVGTPKGAEGEADLSFVREAARRIAPIMAPKTVVTLKSTVVVGTAKEVREIIAEERGALDFWVTSNPEFLREGSAISDFLYPDRIVIGADDRDAAERLIELYRPLLNRDVPLVETGTANAELIKYAANAFLALKIGFINDVADLCESIEGDIQAVARGIGLDKRIGPSFLAPGPGYGGSCFPKDTEAFVATGRRHYAPQPLVETVIERNNKRRKRMADRIVSELETVRKPIVAVMGVAFKADTDDIRESPALYIISYLQESGVKVKAYDPWASENAARVLPDVEWCSDPYEAAEGAHLTAILTEWDVFRTLDLDRLGNAMRKKVLFDCRNILDAENVVENGFRYLSIGRATVPLDASRPRRAQQTVPAAKLVATSSKRS
jgi:UDPglucose 6-dehydrogenase